MSPRRESRHDMAPEIDPKKERRARDQDINLILQNYASPRTKGAQLAPHRHRRILFLLAAFALQIPIMIGMMIADISPSWAIVVLALPIAALLVTGINRSRNP
ncbi:hypothetical protein ACOI1H_13370 [Loktanella sp. DJP18]|uniref:hypothetical protein n=1 Tax=Loktanella sp. DJP18 TaxID=3409788 RepID=UPI003BB66013